MTTTTAEPELREIDELGRLVLNFHEGQLRALDSECRFVCMMGGSQVGKTSFGPHWMHLEIQRALDKLTEEQRRTEGVGDFLAVTSTYDLFNLKMLPEMLEVFVNILKIGKYWAGARVIELTENLEPGGRLWAENSTDRMFGRIILRSAESDAGLEAATAKAAWLDEVGQEQFTVGTWEAIIARLSLSQGRILGTTTLYELGWLKTEWHDRWKAGDPDYDVIQIDSTVNPKFPKEEFERARNSMPIWKFRMRYQGLYAQPAGLVYDSFDPSVCIIDRFPIPESWFWYVGHDFGSANPAQLGYANDPATGIFYVAKEFLPGSKAVPDQVADLKEEFAGKTVIRRAGGSHQEQDSRGNYTAHGWPITEPGVRSVDVGIDRVYALHKRNLIMVFRDCTNYIDEKLRYSRKLADDGSTVLDEIEKKSRFHLMDCERGVLCDFYDRGSRRKPNQVRSGSW